MSRGRKREAGPSIPYYQLRQTVERGYGRRRMIRKNGWWALVIGALIGVAYFWAAQSGESILGITPPANEDNSWFTATIIGVIGGLAIWVVLEFGGLLLEQMDYTTKEADLTEQCIAEIERRGYNTPPALEALQSSASGAGEAVQIRTPLPLAIIGAMVAIFTLSVPGMLKFLVGEVGIMS